MSIDTLIENSNREWAIGAGDSGYFLAWKDDRALVLNIELGNLFGARVSSAAP